MEYSNEILGSVVIMVTYIFIRLWHAIKIKVRPDSCEICDSKRKFKIRRQAFVKLLPFASRQEFCKRCENRYLILVVFKKRLVIIFK